MKHEMYLRRNVVATVLVLAALTVTADERQDYAARLFNREALARAVKLRAEKTPALFPDRDALLAEIASATNAAAMDAVSHKVFFRLPELKNIREIIALRRTGNQNRLGFPLNFHGNTSVPLTGYDNAILRFALDPKAKDRAMRTVYASTNFVGDLDLDFDASRVAFSTRSALTKCWCGAEIPLDGKTKTPREITPTDTPAVHYYNPMYLPNGELMFIGTVGFQGVPCVAGNANVGALILRHADGRCRRLTFDQDENWYPTLTDQGRVMFLRWEYADSAHYFSRILMTMNPDGSDQQEFYGSNSYWPNSMFFARMVPGSTTRFMSIVSGHHGASRKGQLVLFDVAKATSRRETDGAVQTLPGWGKPVKNLTRDRLADVVCGNQYFLHPWPLSDEGALVAVSDRRLGGGKWFIAYVDVYDNQYPLAVLAGKAAHLLQPVPLRARRVPHLPANRVDESKTNCLVNIVSVYNGPGLRGVPKGTVKKLRLYNFEYTPLKMGPRPCGGHYVIGLEGPWDVRVTLGEVDVEEDGSAFFECPANVPVALQPLDKDGRHLQEMRSWFAGMPGETLSCVGCHEKQSIASGPPVQSIASTKRPQQIRPWKGPRRGFAFEREVANVIERRCSGCHNGNPAKKTLLGQRLPKFNGSPREIYNNLHPYVRRNGPEGDYHLLTPLEFHASTSPLVQILERGHYGVRLTPDEWDRLNWWMNLNVPFFGTWTETKQPEEKAIAFRRRYEPRFANITFDPERIVNPYRKVEFTPPDAELKRADVARLAKEMAVRKTDGGTPTAEPFTVALDAQTKITFRQVPAGDGLGTFWMSDREITQGAMRVFDPKFDNGVYDQHWKDQVRRGYYMDMDSEFSDPRARDFPAIRVSALQAEAFCRWLSEKVGRTITLPTEPEWERACRAGAPTPFSFGGLDADWGKYANFAGRNRKLLVVVGVNPKPMKKPPRAWDYELRDNRFDDGHLFLAPVGSLRPNAWGFYDLHGNVSEWTSTLDANGKAVVKGGSWDSLPNAATVAWRWSYPKWMRPYDVGFRVVIRDRK